MFGGAGNWARTFQSDDIKEGRSDLASRSSNCKFYLQAPSFDRGCPAARGGAKSAMNGELSSDATPLAKGPWVWG